MLKSDSKNRKYFTCYCRNSLKKRGNLSKKRITGKFMWVDQYTSVGCSSANKLWWLLKLLRTDRREKTLIHIISNRKLKEHHCELLTVSFRIYNQSQRQDEFFSHLW